MYLRVAFLALLMVLPRAAAASHQWTPLGPGNGTVRAVGIDPQTPATLYAAVEDRGLWKTTDGGQSWHRGPGVPTGVTLFGIAVDPQAPATVYVAGGDAIRKTTDAGATWAAVYTASGTALYSPVIDPQNPAVV